MNFVSALVALIVLPYILGGIPHCFGQLARDINEPRNCRQKVHEYHFINLLSPSEDQQAMSRRNNSWFYHPLPQWQCSPVRNPDRFKSLSPERQQRIFNSAIKDDWHFVRELSPEQRQRLWAIARGLQQLPLNRQYLVTSVIHDLMAVPFKKRQQVVNSDQYSNILSGQERDVVRNAVTLCPPSCP